MCIVYLSVMLGTALWGSASGRGWQGTFPVEMLPEESMVTVTGQIFREDVLADYQVLYVKRAQIQSQEKSVKEPYFIVYVKGEGAFALGNIVEASGSLEFFENERNPGAFSRKKYYRTQKIAACIWTDRAKVVDARTYPFRERLRILRQQWSSKINEVLGEEKGGILNAMLLGDKQQMDPQVKERYQLNGIAHILAISGLHLSFVGMGFYRLVRRLCGSYLAGGMAGITFLLTYILMIGCSVSAVRAVIMFCMQVGADMAGRVNDRATSWGLAMAGVILWRPLAFFDAGFQLSFGAMGAVLFLYPLIVSYRAADDRAEAAPTRQSRVRQLAGNLAESLQVSLCIQLVTMPVILYHYYELPSYAVLLNLIVIPLMSVVLLLGFLGSVLILAIYPMGAGMLRGCGWILGFFDMLCRWAERLPGRRMILGRPEIRGILIYYACLFLMMAVMMWNQKREQEREHKTEPEREPARVRRGVPGLVMAAGMLVLLVNCPAIHHPGLEITFLDVGQGDCAFIRTEEGDTCLIDGGSSDTDQVGRYQIEPFLKSRGVARIDYVLVSHGDQDHINGLQELMERQQEGVEIGCLVLPEQSVWDEKLEDLYGCAVKMQIPAAVIRKGQMLRWKDVTLSCLGPDEALTDPGNEASMVLELTDGELRVLFTGDVEGKGEEYLTDAIEENCTVLKTAHHGSRNSTSDAFLEKAAPELAVISAGRENRYGHPHAETLERLKKAGCAILNTAETGAITLRLTGKEVANLQIIQYNRFYEKFE